MNKSKNNRGFTMVELLAVVAIVGILAAVGFIQVQNYQKSALRLEEDAIAKEIFVAAQNHLTMVRTENYRGLTGLVDAAADTDKDAMQKKHFGVLDTVSADKGKDVFYYLVNQGDLFDSTDPGVLDMILPYASIDEAVRTGGRYLIRYQRRTGIVLDVFYFTEKEGNNRYALGRDLVTDDYKRLLEKRDESGKSNISGRMSYDGKVVGWYGNQAADEIPSSTVDSPVISVINGDVLSVKVSHPLAGVTSTPVEGEKSTQVKIKLIITGLRSGAKRDFLINGTSDLNGRVKAISSTEKEVVLDDITSDKHLHFSDIEKAKGTTIDFLPGENIEIQAVAYNNEEIANIGYSNVGTTNSLFGSLDEVSNTANINSIRHLENLDKTISKLDDSINIDVANQTTDLDWEDFIKNIKNIKKINSSAPSSVSIYDAENQAATAGCYVPISPKMKLEYNGKSNDSNGKSNDSNGKSNDSNDISHSVSNLNVEWAGDAGMFGTMQPESSVKNLALIDSSITASTGNAGALAGTLTNTTVENVIAYNSSNTVEENKITASTGSAGGLVGSMTGTLKAPKDKTPETSTGSIKKSAAALIVNGSDNAGGLIGTASGITVDACYSGGHTIDKTDAAGNTIGGVYDDTVGNYNVTASKSGIAGGLIGAATGMGNIENSYSTCSVSGGTVGGFVGTYEGAAKTYEGVANTNKISNCYATGLVKGIGDDAKEGAFVYKLTQGTAEKCLYYDIINERKNSDGTFATIPALGNETPDTIRSALEDKDGKITALDATAQSYDGFVGGQDKWKNKKAFVYDAKLGEYYNDNNTIVYNLPGIVRLDTITDYAAEDADYFVEYHHGDWPAPEIFVFNEATTSGSSGGSGTGD